MRHCILMTMFFKTAHKIAFSLGLTTASLATLANSIAAPTGWSLLGNNSASTISVSNTFNQTGVTSVWVWNASAAKWAFYTPTLADGGVAYAATKGYDALSTIAPEQGFWVNASQSISVETKTPSAPSVNLRAAYNSFKLDSAGQMTFKLSGACSGTALMTNTAATSGATFNNATALVSTQTFTYTLSAESLKSAFCLSAYPSQTVTKTYYDPVSKIPLGDDAGNTYSAIALPTSATDGYANMHYTYANTSQSKTGVVTYALTAYSSSALMYTSTDINMVSGKPFYSVTQKRLINSDNTLTYVGTTVQVFTDSGSSIVNYSAAN